MKKAYLIDALGLEKHPYEGGYFSRTYTSDKLARVQQASGEPRVCMTSIYYMLTDDSPVCYFHKNVSDIVHYFHLGGAIEYLVIDLEGQVQRFTLGPSLDKGQILQLTVPGGCWKAARLMDESYGLISEAVVPGFCYSDNTIADADSIDTNILQANSFLKDFIKR